MGPNKERIRLWVEALRSGEFAQGREVLHNATDNTYCCLGVACVVAVRNGLKISVEPELDHVNDLDGDVRAVTVTAYDRGTTYLPPMVWNWFGFASEDPDIAVRENEIRLRKVTATDANDDFNWSFEKIANAVENTYLTNETETDENNGNDTE